MNRGIPASVFLGAKSSLEGGSFVDKITGNLAIFGVEGIEQRRTSALEFVMNAKSFLY